MDLAQKLIRKVMRAFYEPRYIVIIDSLIRYTALRDDDLAYIMVMNTKDLHKLCAKLRDDRFLEVATKAEYREGQQRPVNRTYYYIDYRQTIDAIKWRIYVIDKELRGDTVPANERKEYFCSRCNAEWTQLQVLDSYGPQGFTCHRCGWVLTHDPERHSAGHEKYRRMREQFSFMTDLLQQIDQVTIPENNLEIALSKARPVPRRDFADPSRAGAGTGGSAGAETFHRPTAVKGLANTGPRSMQVSISSSDGPTEEEKAAELARKEQIAKQNALPSWMANSTVTGESFSIATDTKLATPAAKEEDTKGTALKQAVTTAQDHAEIDDYFARLKAQQAAEAAQRERELAEEAEEDFGSEEEEEDEGDFEDVGISGANTPGGGASTPAFAPVAPSPLRQATSAASLATTASQGAKRRGSTSDGTSLASTPAADGAGQPPASKKVKLEDPSSATAQATATAAAADSDGEESEEDVEFQDV